MSVRRTATLSFSLALIFTLAFLLLPGAGASAAGETANGREGGPSISSETASLPVMENRTQVSVDTPAESVREEYPPEVTEPTAVPTLTEFERKSWHGFGDIHNRYAWSMVDFKGDLYVGTWNVRVICLPSHFLWALFPDWFEDPPQVSCGAEVFRYEYGLLGRDWRNVVEHGLGDEGNVGVRNMVVWEDDPNGAAIYATTSNGLNGLEIWRTEDGDEWERVVDNGFDEGPGNKSGRGMVAFRDHLYVGTKGLEGGQVRRTDDGTDWDKVLTGNEMEENLGAETARKVKPKTMSSMCIYDDGTGMGEALFVGSWREGGFKVFKSYTGEPGSFQEVATNGILNRHNGGVMRLIPFQGRLWLLAYNVRDGFEVYASDSENGINGNDDWRRIASAGFTDPRNWYAWSGEVYDNGSGERLYIGTCNTSGGFHLYSVTPEGEWAVEVGTDSEAPAPPGIESPFNYGIRTMDVFWDKRDSAYKLTLGTAGLAKPLDIYMAR